MRVEDVSSQLLQCELQQSHIINDDSIQQKGPKCEQVFNKLGSLETVEVLGLVSTVVLFLSRSCCVWCFIHLYRGTSSPCNCLFCASFIMKCHVEETGGFCFCRSQRKGDLSTLWRIMEPALPSWEALVIVKCQANPPT